jgi:hypothetical protein
MFFILNTIISLQIIHFLNILQYLEVLIDIVILHIYV